LVIRRELGDRPGQVASLLNLGLVAASEGRYDQSVAHNRWGFAIAEELGDRRGQANSLATLGVVHQRQGRYQEALACLHDSLAIYRELGDPHADPDSPLISALWTVRHCTATPSAVTLMVLGCRTSPSTNTIPREGRRTGVGSSVSRMIQTPPGCWATLLERIYR